MCLRENNVGLYSVDAYFYASNLVEMPFDLIFSSLTVVIMYYMINLNSEFVALMEMILVNIGMVQAGIALGMILHIT